VSQFVLTFSEDLSTQSGTAGASSILNPLNWQLTDNGIAINGGVNKVVYGLNEAYLLGLESQPSNKYEAVVTFDGDAATAGNQALTSVGDYKLTILSNVTDIFGNKFDGAYTGVASNFVWSFTVGGTGLIPVPPTPPGPPTTSSTDIVVNSKHTDLADGVNPDVASDASGDYVVVWNTNSYDETATDPGTNQTIAGGDIAVQRFDKYGTPLGTEFVATPHTKVNDGQGNVTYLSNGLQTGAAVAMDAYGEFVVVWSGDGTKVVNSDGTTVNLGDDSGIFAQIYDKNGKPVGNTFLVNQTVVGTQDQPAVAMDANGDFVVSWTSDDVRSSVGGIYARRFTIQGTAVTNEVAVSPASANRQENSAVAIDGSGNFTVVWQSDSPAWDLFGQQFTAAGIKRGGEMAINTYTADKQVDPAIAMDPNGDFVVAWESFGEDGSGYGVYARRYSPAGAALDAQEFRVNTTTLNWQITPDVGMANNGAFTVVWSAFGQDNLTASNPTSDYGIYAHMYNANGTDYRDPATGAIVGEYRVNTKVVGDQMTPAVSVAANGEIAAVWTGPESYLKSYPDGSSYNTNDLQVLGRVIVPSSNPQPGNSGPTISQVGVSQVSGMMSWNALDSDGIASCTLTIDGTAISGIGGPYSAASGVNYSVSYGSLGAGTHAYVISATDKLGNSSTLNGSFTLTSPAPTPSGLVISGVGNSTVNKFLSWNIVASAGVKATSIKIDGTTVLKVNGPYKAASGANYSAVYGTLSPGEHYYVIRVTDKAGNTSSLVGTFTVPAPVANSGPTIGSVAISFAKGALTWNAADSDGIGSVALTIDNQAVSKIYGPYTASIGGYYYSGVMGSLSAGDHSYVITATDKLGNVSSLPGTFTAPAPAANSGPTISGVAVSLAKSKMSWNLLDSDGIGSVGLTVDGAAVSGIAGPYNATSGKNYSWSFASLKAGVHNYTIRATDKLGNVSTYDGSFTTAAASGSAMNALYSKAALDALANSAKVDWVYDLGGLSNTQSSSSDDKNTKATDAIMAAYQ
jgi:hypothetical protein